MNKRLYELKKETNYCAGVGEIACLLEHIGEAVVLVNGPRFLLLANETNTSANATI